jgi:hypothetical protein
MQLRLFSVSLTYITDALPLKNIQQCGIRYLEFSRAHRRGICSYLREDFCGRGKASTRMLDFSNRRDFYCRLSKKLQLCILHLCRSNRQVGEREDTFLSAF